MSLYENVSDHRWSAASGQHMTYALHTHIYLSLYLFTAKITTTDDNDETTNDANIL